MGKLAQHSDPPRASSTLLPPGNPRRRLIKALDPNRRPPLPLPLARPRQTLLLQSSGALTQLAMETMTQFFGLANLVESDIAYVGAAANLVVGHNVGAANHAVPDLQGYVIPLEEENHEEKRMGCRHGAKGSRGSHMLNAVPPRSRARRFAAGADGLPDGMPEVPFYLVGLKGGKKARLNERRNVMKARMALKAGITGYTCPPGSMGLITYPLSEDEKTLLNSMGGLLLEDADVPDADN